MGFGHFLKFADFGMAGKLEERDLVEIEAIGFVDLFILEHLEKLQADNATGSIESIAHESGIDDKEREREDTENNG